MTMSGKASDFLIVTPKFLTSCGKKGCACEKRLLTRTLSMSGSVPTSNVTTWSIEPSLALVDWM